MTVPLRRHALVRLVVVLAAGLLGGCASTTGPGANDLPELSWPPGEPRVRLERIISSPRDLSRRSLLSWITGKKETALFERPYGVAWHGDALIVTDPGAARVLRIDADGKVTRSADRLFESPIGVASCSGVIVVADSRTGRVVTLDDELRHVDDLGSGLNRPTGVACADGRIAVVETGAHRIVLFDADSERRAIGRRGASPGDFNFPSALAADDSGLWVGDTLNFRVQHVDTASGAATASFGQLGDAPGETPRIKGITVDAAGHLWVSDGHLDSIALFMEDGTLLMEMGGTGPEPGSLSFPAGITAHTDGRVAVADSLNRRIQVYRLIETLDTHDD